MTRRKPIMSAEHKCRARRSAGFTLAEVAVALAIFVFGALAIVRIFPPALDVIRNSESRTTATLLAQGTTERLRRETYLVPDAIYDANPIYDGAFTGTANRNASLPNDIIPTAFDASALGHFRQISGERQTVKTNTSATQLFVLTQFPYISAPSVYKQDRVIGATIDSTGTLNFSNATLASDPTTIYAPNAAHKYYVSYQWLDTTTRTSIEGGVVEEPLLIPTSPATVLEGVRNPANHIIPGPISIRVRIPVSTIATPYNKLGYLPVSGVNAGDVISVDYEVEGWTWLVDDKTPTVTPPNMIDNPTDVADYPATARVALLPVRHIDQEFEVRGLLAAPDPTNPAQRFSIQFGEWRPNVATAPLLLPSAASADQTQRKEDSLRRNGHAVYNSGSIPGARARTVYRAVDGWAHQLSVAARSYVPYVNYAGRDINRHPQEWWREYYWPGSGDKLYFHANEAGKTIFIRYLYTPSGGGSPQLQERVLTIDEDLESTPLAAFANGRVSQIEILNTGDAGSVNGILSIQGLGIQARTAWINRDRYAQSVVASYRPLD